MKAPNYYCNSFQEEASRVWSDMSEAESFGLPRNEETTTEELLLRLARKHKGSGLDVKAYTKTDESVSGADWAFWFAAGPRKGIGVRIQAKRLFNENKQQTYKSLYHQSKKQSDLSKKTDLLTPNQCETLLNYKDGLLPIYIFYNSNAFNANASDDEKISVMNKLGSYTCPLGSPEWGISTASALAIKKASWGKNNQLGNFLMLPWHCLVCHCSWNGSPSDPSLPSLVSYGLRQLYSYGIGDDSAELGFSFEPTVNVPKWVSLLREGRESDSFLDEEMGRLNLKGVAIIDEVESRDE